MRRQLNQSSELENNLASYVNSRYPQTEWKQVSDSRIFPISIQKYYDTFWSDSGKFNPEQFALQNDEQRNVSAIHWNNNKYVLHAIVKVNGVPFIDEATSTGTYTLIENSKDRVVIELTTETQDTPYSKTFVAHEVWIGTSSPSDNDKVLFKRYMKIEMREWSWYEGYIIGAAEKNIVDNDKVWFELATKNGLFVKDEIIEAPKEEEAQPSAPLIEESK